MRVLFSVKALHDYQEAPKRIQQAVDKQFSFLLQNFRHPSLRVKKYDEANDIWQGRITGDWRFYFQIRGTVYFVITIIKHPE